MRVRNKLSILLYLSMIVLWSISADKNRDLEREQVEYAEAIDKYDQLKTDHDQLNEEHDYLVEKHEVVLDYANSWHVIDWDKAVELNKKQ